MILITGSSGFIGSSLVKILPFEMLKLMGRSITSNQKNYYQKSLNKNENYADVLQNVEVVIHCAAKNNNKYDRANDIDSFYDVNVEGTINLATQAAHAGVKRFIYLSSIKVNGEITSKDKPFTSFDKPAPKDSYGMSKFEAEVGLKKIAAVTDMEVVIIRPPLVYGADVKGNFAIMLNIIKKGIPLPFGSVNNKRSLVSVFNLVDLIVKCVDHPRAANQTFLISDGNDLSTTELLRKLGETLGKSPILLPVPVFIMASIAKLLGKKTIANRLFGSLQVDIKHTCETLSWQPPLSIEESMKRSFRD